MIISKKKMLIDLKTSIVTKLLCIFGFVGFIVPVIPFVAIGEVNTNSVISFAFLLCVFGIPFGYFIGIRNIIHAKKLKKSIKNNNFIIHVDEITVLKSLGYGTTGDMDDNFCRLMLKKYSADKKSTVIVKADEFSRLKKGDRCILIFIPNVKNPILVYPGNEYSIDMTLNDKIKDWTSIASL